MSIPAQPQFRRFFLQFSALLLAATIAFGVRAYAQNAATRDRIYVVTHIDTLPAVPGGARILQQYAADSRKDKGAVRIELYTQISRVNHFTMVEVWENQAALDAHIAAPHTKQFREDIQPTLGSPFDERLHQIVE